MAGGASGTILSDDATVCNDLTYFISGLNFTTGRLSNERIYYQGEFDQGQRHGAGKEFNADGSLHYEGQFLRHK